MSSHCVDHMKKLAEEERVRKENEEAANTARLEERARQEAEGIGVFTCHLYLCYVTTRHALTCSRENWSPLLPFRNYSARTGLCSKGPDLRCQIGGRNSVIGRPT